MATYACICEITKLIIHLPSAVQESDKEEKQINNNNDGNDYQTTPVAASCPCGDVAYNVGKNSADAYLKKEGEVSVATQYFNKVEKEKKNTKKEDGTKNKSAPCCIK